MGARYGGGVTKMEAVDRRLRPVTRRLEGGGRQMNWLFKVSPLRNEGHGSSTLDGQSSLLDGQLGEGFGIPRELATYCRGISALPLHKREERAAPT